MIKCVLADTMLAHLIISCVMHSIITFFFYSVHACMHGQTPSGHGRYSISNSDNYSMRLINHC